MRGWLINSLVTGGPVLIVADAVAKATVLLCLTAAIAAVLRRSAAAVRHRLWSLTSFGLIVLPLLSWLLPGWRVPILPAMVELPGSRVFRDARAAESSSHHGPNTGATDRILSMQPGADRGPSGLAPPHRTAHADAGSGASSLSSSLVQSLVVPGAAQRETAPLMLLWALGFLAVASPALAGIVHSEWRRRRSRPVTDQNWLQLLDGLTRQFTLRRPIDLRTCPVPFVPVTWGVFRPVVLLPEQAQQWAEPLRRNVLLHELSHIKRGDVGFQLIGRLATAVYWFHPLAWYALRRLRAECESACDDYVVHVGSRRTDYAQQLVDLARTLRADRLTVAVPMARKNTLEERIKALFDERRSHEPLSHRLARALFIGGLVVVTSIAVVHLGPSLAAQQQETTPPPATKGTAQAGQQPKPAAAVIPVQKNPPAAATPNGSIRDTYTYPITVTGRALDLTGKPIPGAQVYLASRRADYKRVAETTTDAEGRYKFHDVPLPIERANTVRGRDEGAFQVFGQAEGFGFAWRPQKWFFPHPKPANITYEPEHRDPPVRYEANDKIALDLRFPPSAHLAGTIVDDRGNPLAGVRLEIRACEALKVVDNVFPGWTLDALNETDSVPQSMKIRVTAADGRFDFTGLPVDTRFWIHLRAKNFPRKSFFAATTDRPQADHDGGPVLNGEIKVVMATPVDVPIKMVFGDTGKPAPKVAVQAVDGLVNVLETTDDQGRVTLRLPPGKYRMENWPARGTPYLVTEGELVVVAKPPAELVVATLRPAAVIEVTVVDAETGAGIPDVDLWQRDDLRGGRERLVFRSWEVATRIAWREGPRTDAHGKLRALVEPGKHQIGVGLESYPQSHEVVEREGQDVESRAGESVQLKFTMRRRP